MITAIFGTLAKIYEEEVRIDVGAYEHQVLVPELVRRALQLKQGEPVRLFTVEFLEGNPTRGKIVPRLIGFLSEPEIDFFELFCTVDGIGVRTALKAMVRPIKDIADMIQRQDTALLATLPGISSSLAERVVAKLRKKVTKFALMSAATGTKATADETKLDVIEEAFAALVSVGHSDLDARRLLDKTLTPGKKFKSAQDILLEVYQNQ